MRRSLEQAERGKLAAQPWMHDLQHGLRLRDVAQLYRAHILQRDVSRKSSSHQVCNALRDERLTAVRDAHDSRRAVDGSAKEVAVTLLDHAGMDAAAHLELNALSRVRVRERREE